MLGFKPKTDEVLNHWIAFVDNFALPPQEFYASVEQGLAASTIPGLKVSRFSFREGGLLSDKRIYLRMIRERLAFDICAAPFGTHFFFSCRTVYSPAIVRFWHILLVIFLFGIVGFLLQTFLAPYYAAIATFGLMLAVIQIFRNTIAMGLADLDTTLLKIPAIGPIYERWFRKETYYRQDTRLVYLEVVPKLIKDLAEEVTASKGVKLVRQYERAPILGELYKSPQQGATPVLTK